jgi:hypothetical protein
MYIDFLLEEEEEEEKGRWSFVRFHFIFIMKISLIFPN